MVVQWHYVAKVLSGWQRVAISEAAHNRRMLTGRSVAEFSTSIIRRWIPL